MGDRPAPSGKSSELSSRVSIGLVFFTQANRPKFFWVLALFSSIKVAEVIHVSADIPAGNQGGAKAGALISIIQIGGDDRYPRATGYMIKTGLPVINPGASTFGGNGQRELIPAVRWTGAGGATYLRLPPPGTRL